MYINNEYYNKCKFLIMPLVMLSILSIISQYYFYKKGYYNVLFWCLILKTAFAIIFLSYYIKYDDKIEGFSYKTGTQAITPNNNLYNSKIVNMHVKTAADPLSTYSSIFGEVLSLDKLDLNMKSGVRGLVLNVIYDSMNSPVVCSGYLNGDTFEKTSNSLPFIDVLTHINSTAFTDGKTDPLFLIIKVFHTSKENEYGYIAKELKEVFDDKLKKNGEYLKYNKKFKFKHALNKVILCVSNAGINEIDNELNEILFNDITEFNVNSALGNAVVLSMVSLCLIIPSDDNQTIANCSIPTDEYFDYGIQFIAMKYINVTESNMTDDSCVNKYNEKFGPHAFIEKKNINISKRIQNI